MDVLLEKIRIAYEFLLFYPKSTTTSAILLLIVILIAFFVNRKRDASGNISFVDKARTGVVGVRVYEMEEGYRKRSWLFPLWIPEKRLLLNVRILLPTGEYEIKAYWREEVSEYVIKGLFAPRPIEKEKAHSLSDFGSFKASKEMPVEFRLTVSGKKAQIDSPDISALELNLAKKPFPLIISDPSIKKLPALFERAKKGKIWELSVIDERILTHLETEVKGVKRKLDGAVIKNKDLKSDLDRVVRELNKRKDEGKGKSGMEPFRTSRGRPTSVETRVKGT